MKQVWRKEKPRTPGYTRAFVMETPLGDQLEAEFQFHEQLVRLTVTVKEEKSRMYGTTIKGGAVLAEKDITSGRAYPVFRKIWPFRDFFGQIPDKDLVSAIGGAYDIYPPFVRESETRSERRPGNLFSTRYDSVFGIVRETRFQRWKRLRREAREARGSLWERFRRRIWGDLQDISLGLGLGTLVYYLYYDYVILGVSLAGYGMLAGLWDFLFRKRSVLLTKVLSFLSFGSYFFYNGYVHF